MEKEDVKKRIEELKIKAAELKGLINDLDKKIAEKINSDVKTFEINTEAANRAVTHLSLAELNQTRAAYEEALIKVESEILRLEKGISGWGTIKISF